MATHTATDGRVTIHTGTRATMTTGTHPTIPTGTHLTIHIGTDLTQAGDITPTGQVTTTVSTMDIIQGITVTVTIPGDPSTTGQDGWLTTTAPSPWVEAWEQQPAQQADEG